VLLTPDVSTWLAQNVGGRVDEGDLERTYAFEHPLNASRELRRQGVERRSPPEHVLWHVEFFDPAGGRVLERPLARKVFAAERLFGRMPAVGAVAYNAMLYLREECRRQRFGRTVYASEAELYERWGIREIHMRALEDGPAVWVRHFGFLPCEPEVLAQAYVEWAPRHGHQPDPPSRAADYPAPFLSEQQGLMLYKVLA
jgi:hypothetical protein